jgi:hypothetical protein
LGKALAVKVAEVQNMARHVLRNALAVRAALESAVQVGRGNEGNRQAEMANLRNVGIRYRWSSMEPTRRGDWARGNAPQVESAAPRRAPAHH